MARRTTKPKPKGTRPARRTYTEEQRAEALDVYVEHGPAETERRIGIPKRTVTRWAKAAGLSTEVVTKTATAVEAAALTLEQRKQNLADRLLTVAGQVLDQIDQPSVERKIVTLSGKVVVGVDEDGRPELGSGWTVAEVHRERPTYADQRQIMTTVAIAVDKVQVLTGGATQHLAVSGDVDREVKSVAAEIVSLAAARERKAG